MQLIHALTLAATFATAVVAQTPSIDGLPTCARSCVGASFGGCNQLSVSCICSNKDYISNLSCCISKACNKADQDSTIQFASQICQIVGVTVPTQASCAADAGTTATSTGATGAATSATSGAATTSAPGTSSAATTGTATTGSASSRASSAAAQSSTGAAVHNAGNTFGMGVAVAGLLAML